MNNLRNIFAYTTCIFLWYSCQKDETLVEDTLAELTSAIPFKVDNVIACASTSDTDTNTIFAYFYPRPGASDFRYYETASIEDDKNDYTKYRQIDIVPTDLFNGYLKKFSRTLSQEKWVIITFLENEELHLSNPIRLKQNTKPTEFTDLLEIELATMGMPVFTWKDGIYQHNKIYFQIISDMENDLLSGTYTFDTTFQYYTLENVVLNITRDIPPVLQASQEYKFTLMGVSEDNWVNLIVEKDFNP